MNGYLKLLEQLQESERELADLHRLALELLRDGAPRRVLDELGTISREIAGRRHVIAVELSSVPPRLGDDMSERAGSHTGAPPGRTGSGAASVLQHLAPRSR